MILSFGTFRTEFARHCWATQRNYAERLGVPFVKKLTPPEPFATKRKLKMLDKHGPETGRVLYLDWDMEIAPDAVDVFERKDRFCMFVNYHESPNSTPNAGLLLSDIEVFREMLPIYRHEFAAQQQHNAREEWATYRAAQQLGVAVTELNPKGFHHHIGPQKWTRFQPRFNYETATC